MKSIQNFVGGKFVPGNHEFEDINPADGTVVAQVGEADSDLVDQAVHAARKALHGEWGKLSIRDRAARLY